ncbi:MAG TPA: hypothetical protein VHE37_17215 [Nevskiaceae bacterium]|nr:hypothetical protein [Nevskiaceae bacterium]
MPAYVAVAVVIAAAVYAFSPRPQPAFAPTAIHPDRILVNGLAQQGSRIVAVGELGRVLLADQPDGPWHEAEVQPQRGSTLTQVKFIADHALLAVGHDGWIIGSTDNGEHWKELAFTAPPPDEAPAPNPSMPEGAPPLPDIGGGMGGPPPANPLMGVAGPFDGKLFVFGGFGELRSSTDGGKSWNAISDAAIGDKHVNAMAQLADGSLLAAGERGLLVRSTDLGATWKALPQIYNGSFFGLLTLPDHKIVAYGMRGNVYVSADNGASWKKSEVPDSISLFGGAVDADGTPVLVGEGDSVLRSTDGGATFSVATSGKRERLVAVLPQKGGWLAAGEGGIMLLHPAAAAGEHS